MFIPVDAMASVTQVIAASRCCLNREANANGVSRPTFVLASRVSVSLSFMMAF
jgi:hypothetical protein